MGRLKMRDMNLRHQFARLEIAGHENAGPICRGGKGGKSLYGKPKCEKMSQRLKLIAAVDILVVVVVSVRDIGSGCRNCVGTNTMTYSAQNCTRV